MGRNVGTEKSASSFIQRDLLNREEERGGFQAKSQGRRISLTDLTEELFLRKENEEDQAT